MGAGLSNSLDMREKRRREKNNRKVIAEDRAAPERKERSPVKPEPSAPTTGIIVVNVDQGSPESRLPQEAEPQASTHEGIKDAGPMPAQDGPWMEGGILNKAQGVHIGGSATLIAAQNYNVYPMVAQSDVSEKDAQLFEKIVEWLSDVNYHAIQADNYGKRAEGTGKWAFEDPMISKWLEGALGILWGIGMPGAGKTVLASFIIDHLLQKAKANKRICVAFAFSRYTDQFTGEKLLGGLLRQVVEDHPSTLQFVKPMYDHHCLRRTRPSQKELIDVLRAIFNSDLFDERYCTLDGLDEALDDTQVDVLDAFSNLPVNFLIMSRPLPLLKELVPEATFIDILVHDADIEQLIEEKLRRTRKLRNLVEKDDWKERVVKTIVEKSSGMFILASLQIDMLGECMHIKDLRSALEALPMGINTMYKVTMERIGGRPGSDLALRALTWLVYARESLMMDDLRHALAVNPTAFTYDSELLVDSETLLSACCGLITLETRTSLVRLVHYTAHDYLKSYLLKAGVDAEAMLACTCISRLRGCGFQNYTVGGRLRYYDEIFAKHPLLEYAHRHWVTHAQSSKSQPSSIEEFIQHCQHFPWISDHYPWSDVINSIQLAAVYNFHTLLARWLGLDPLLATCPPAPTVNVNSKSTLGRTALTFAAINGHCETVALLIGVEGIDIRCTDLNEFTPLMHAARRSHVSVVEMLLGVVDADHVNTGPCTALMEAGRHGHTEVMKVLLRVQGIDVNATVPQSNYGDCGDSALIIAARRDQSDAVQLLLGVDGIDVNISDGVVGTAIAQAARLGRTEIVKILMQREDVDINFMQSHEWTALMNAALRGHKDIVELLLQHENININFSCPRKGTALILAVKAGHNNVVELLLQQKDIDVSAATDEHLALFRALGWNGE